MTTLYLHCGIHKTGSSFLQILFTRNRTLLKNHGIHYPKSEMELEMLRGEISPGNGVHLARTLLQEEKNILDLLADDLAMAEEMNLQSVLYSSENMFHNFAENDSVHKLCHASKSAGYDEIKVLVYFRDPVSHAISTYKHRAKNGDHPDFNVWFQTGYETYDLIRSFLHYMETSGIEWSCSKYSPDSTQMIKSSFIDWLEIEAPDIPEDDCVNRSLQLSDIRILQVLKKEFPGSESYLREALMSVPTKNKEKDDGLRSEFYSQAVKLLKDYTPLRA